MTKFSIKDKETIKAIVAAYGNDEHSVYPAKSLLETGIRPELAKQFVRTNESDRFDHKATLFGRDGEIIDETQVVYGLTVLEAIADDLGLDYPSKMGRVFRVQVATKAIVNWLKG